MNGKKRIKSAKSSKNQIGKNQKPLKSKFLKASALKKKNPKLKKKEKIKMRNDRSDDIEFRKRLTELTYIVEKNGKQLDPKEIIQSDIILPSPDLSIEEAKRLFKGDGVVPEF